MKSNGKSMLAILLTLVLFFTAPGCSYEDYEDPGDTGNYNQAIYRTADTSLTELAEHGDYIVLAFFEVDRGELSAVYLPELDNDMFDYYTDFLEYSYDELIAFQENLDAAELLWDAVSGIFPQEYLHQIA